MKKERVQIILLILLLLTIVSYSYYSYALSPKLQAIGNQKDQIAERQERLAHLQTEAQQREQHEQRVQELQLEYQVLKAQIPSMLSKPQLIYYFYNIVAQFGIEDAIVGFGEAATEGGYSKLSISFSGTSTVADVLDLCEDLQSSANPRITVDSLSVSPGVLTSSFNMKLFGYSEQLDANPDAEKEFMDVPFGISIPEDIRLNILDEADMVASVP